MRSVLKAQVQAVRDGHRTERADVLVVEEPLEIRIRHGPDGAESSLGITMRTPGQDEDLTAGFLLSEGIISKSADIRGFAQGNDRDGMPDANVVVARLDPRVPFVPHVHERANVRTAACGVCGRATLDDLRARGVHAISLVGPTFRDGLLRSLPELLRANQATFEATGGLHAAALFTPDGSIGPVREDVGRHNAVDKLVGAQLMARRIPLGDYGLLVSGRAGYEILQKALVAGIPLVAAIGAPSSLAVDLAREFGQTLVGFLRTNSYNVYCHERRIET